jgi:hypothetical protein
VCKGDFMKRPFCSGSDRLVQGGSSTKGACAQHLAAVLNCINAQQPQDRVQLKAAGKEALNGWVRSTEKECRGRNEMGALKELLCDLFCALMLLGKCSDILLSMLDEFPLVHIWKQPVGETMGDEASRHQRQLRRSKA